MQVAGGRLTFLGQPDVIEVSGSAYEQGRIHGQRARQAITANIKEIRRWMNEVSSRGRRWDHEGILSRNERFISRVSPEVLEEVRGIADGAGLSYRETLELNAPLFVAAAFLPLDCSQLLLRPPATRDGGTYLAKTRDLRGWLDHVVLHRREAGGRELAEVHVAGSVTWPGSGVSSDGVAFSTSGCWSPRTIVDLDRADASWLLTNGHLLLRDSRMLDEFVAHLDAQPRMCPLNVVAADCRGGAAVEVTADRVYRSDAEGGVLIRTNHFLTPEIRAQAPTPDENPSSYHRYAVATRKLRAGGEAWDLGAMITLLGDHEGYPQNSICRHSQNGEGSDTAYASITVLPAGEFWTTLAHPCGVQAPLGR